MMTQHPGMQQRSRHCFGPDDSIFRDNASETSAGSLRGRLPLDSTGTSTSRPSSSSYQSERSADSPVRRPPHIGGHRRHPAPVTLPPQATQTQRVAEFHFDESEYDIVHSNAVETTEMTPFYPQPRLRLSRRSGGGGGSSGICVECGEDCECDSCSLISSSAASCRSRKSRKSSIGSTSKARREMRKSAAAAAAAANAAAAAAAISAGSEGCQSGVTGAAAASVAAASAAVASPPAANLFANIRGLFTKWLRETKATSAGSSAAISADNHEGGVANGACGGGANGVKAQYLNIACPQFPQECSNSDLQHAHNVMSMSSSFDSDYLLHCYTSPSACSSAASDLPSTPCRTEDGDTEQSVYGAAGAFSVGGGTVGSGGAANGYGCPGRGGASLSTVNGFFDWSVQLDYDLLQRRNPRQAACRMLDAAATARSWSLQSQTGGGGRERKDQLLLCSTWPPSGWRLAALGSGEKPLNTCVGD